MAGKTRRRKRKQEGSKGILLIALVVMILFIAITVQRVKLDAESQEYAKTEASYSQKIKEAEKTKEELAEKEKYMQTDKYIEDTAKEKLGLVNPDEKIFKPKE